MNLYRQKILDSHRLDFLKKLSRTKWQNFYLAGWTWLALFYGHRKSYDFDFFSNQNIDIDQILHLLKKEGIEFEIKSMKPDTLDILTEDNVKISFFATPWIKQLNPFVKTEYFDVASDFDIWVMKLVAITHRASYKDYVDLYYILQKYSLKELIASIPKKYWNVVILSAHQICFLL